MSKKFSTRLFSATLSAAFFLTNAAVPYAQELNFWQGRRSAAQFAGRGQDLASTPGRALLSQLPPAAKVPLAAKTPATGRFDWLSQAAAAHGVVQETYISPKPGAPLVVHIQDAHGLEDAQRNIAALIQILTQQGPIGVVALEGASKSFRLDAFRQGDPGLTKDAAELFLKKGLIGGPEYAGLTAPVSLDFQGAEDPALYAANVAAVKTSFKERAALAPAIKALRAESDRLAAAHFSPSLKDFDALCASYAAGKATLAAYVEGLAAAAPPSPDMVQVRALRQALKLERGLNFERVERERRELVEELVAHLSREDLQTLTAKSVDQRAGRMGFAAYHQYLRALCRRNGLPLENRAALAAYIDYLTVAEKVKASALFPELERLEKTAWKNLAATPTQARLMEARAGLNLLQKLLDHQMAGAEWRAYEKKRPEMLRLAETIGELGGRKLRGLSAAELKPYEDFCSLALRRNEALVEKTLARATAAKGAVLVAGGFHTEGLTRLLKEKQISYVVLMPRFTLPAAENDYLSVLATDAPPLERLLAGERLSLAKAPPLEDPNSPASTLFLSIERAAAGLATDGAAQPCDGVHTDDTHLAFGTHAVDLSRGTGRSHTGGVNLNLFIAAAQRLTDAAVAGFTSLRASAGKLSSDAKTAAARIVRSPGFFRFTLVILSLSALILTVMTGDTTAMSLAIMPGVLGVSRIPGVGGAGRVPGAWGQMGPAPFGSPFSSTFPLMSRNWWERRSVAFTAQDQEIAKTWLARLSQLNKPEFFQQFSGLSRRGFVAALGLPAETGAVSPGSQIFLERLQMAALARAATHGANFDSKAAIVEDGGALLEWASVPGQNDPFAGLFVEVYGSLEELPSAGGALFGSFGDIRDTVLARLGGLASMDRRRRIEGLFEALARNGRHTGFGNDGALRAMAAKFGSLGWKPLPEINRQTEPTFSFDPAAINQLELWASSIRDKVHTGRLHYLDLATFSSQFDQPAKITPSLQQLYDIVQLISLAVEEDHRVMGSAESLFDVLTRWEKDLRALAAWARGNGPLPKAELLASRLSGLQIHGLKSAGAVIDDQVNKDYMNWFVANTRPLDMAFAMAKTRYQHAKIDPARAQYNDELRKLRALTGDDTVSQVRRAQGRAELEVLGAELSSAIEGEKWISEDNIDLNRRDVAIYWRMLFAEASALRKGDPSLQYWHQIWGPAWQNVSRKVSLLNTLRRSFAQRQTAGPAMVLKRFNQTVAAGALWLAGLVPGNARQTWVDALAQAENIVPQRWFARIIAPLTEFWGMPGFAIAFLHMGAGLWAVPLASLLFALLHLTQDPPGQKLRGFITRLAAASAINFLAIYLGPILLAFDLVDSFAWNTKSASFAIGILGHGLYNWFATSPWGVRWGLATLTLGTNRPLTEARVALNIKRSEVELILSKLETYSEVTGSESMRQAILGELQGLTDKALAERFNVVLETSQGAALQSFLTHSPHQAVESLYDWLTAGVRVRDQEARSGILPPQEVAAAVSPYLFALARLPNLFSDNRPYLIWPVLTGSAIHPAIQAEALRLVYNEKAGGRNAFMTTYEPRIDLENLMEILHRSAPASDDRSGNRPAAFVGVVSAVSSALSAMAWQSPGRVPDLFPVFPFVIKISQGQVTGVAPLGAEDASPEDVPITVRLVKTPSNTWALRVDNGGHYLDSTLALPDHFVAKAWSAPHRAAFWSLDPSYAHLEVETIGEFVGPIAKEVMGPVNSEWAMARARMNFAASSLSAKTPGSPDGVSLALDPSQFQGLGVWIDLADLGSLRKIRGINPLARLPDHNLPLYRLRVTRENDRWIIQDVLGNRSSYTDADLAAGVSLGRASSSEDPSRHFGVPVNDTNISRNHVLLRLEDGKVHVTQRVAGVHRATVLYRGMDINEALFSQEPNLDDPRVSEFVAFVFSQPRAARQAVLAYADKDAQRVVVWLGKLLHNAARERINIPQASTIVGLMFDIQIQHPEVGQRLEQIVHYMLAGETAPDWALNHAFQWELLGRLAAGEEFASAVFSRALDADPRGMSMTPNGKTSSTKSALDSGIMSVTTLDDRAFLASSMLEHVRRHLVQLAQQPSGQIPEGRIDIPLKITVAPNGQVLDVVPQDDNRTVMGPMIGSQFLSRDLVVSILPAAQPSGPRRLVTSAQNYLNLSEDKPLVLLPGFLEAMRAQAAAIIAAANDTLTRQIAKQQSLIQAAVNSLWSMGGTAHGVDLGRFFITLTPSHEVRMAAEVQAARESADARSESTLWKKTVMTQGQELKVSWAALKAGIYLDGRDFDTLMQEMKEDEAVPAIDPAQMAGFRAHLQLVDNVLVFSGPQGEFHRVPVGEFTHGGHAMYLGRKSKTPPSEPTIDHVLFPFAQTPTQGYMGPHITSVSGEALRLEFRKAHLLDAGGLTIRSKGANNASVLVPKQGKAFSVAQHWAALAGVAAVGAALFLIPGYVPMDVNLGLALQALGASFSLIWAPPLAFAVTLEALAKILAPLNLTPDMEIVAGINQWTALRSAFYDQANPPSKGWLGETVFTKDGKALVRIAPWLTARSSSAAFNWLRGSLLRLVLAHEAERVKKDSTFSIFFDKPFTLFRALRGPSFLPKTQLFAVPMANAAGTWQIRFLGKGQPEPIREHFRMLAPEILANLSPSIVGPVSLSPENFTGEVRAKFHERGKTKAVYEVEVGLKNGRHLTLALIAIRRGGKTETAFDRFVPGLTFQQRLERGQVTAQVRQNVLRAVLELAKILNGAVPFDLHGGNVVVDSRTDQAVVVDLQSRPLYLLSHREADGRRVTPSADDHLLFLAMMLAQYGFVGAADGDNQPLLDAFEETLGREGRLILRNALDRMRALTREETIAFLAKEGRHMFREILPAEKSEQPAVFDRLYDRLLSDLSTYLGPKPSTTPSWHLRPGLQRFVIGAATLLAGLQSPLVARAEEHAVLPAAAQTAALNAGPLTVNTPDIEHGLDGLARRKAARKTARRIDTGALGQGREDSLALAQGAVLEAAILSFRKELATSLLGGRPARVSEKLAPARIQNLKSYWSADVENIDEFLDVVRETSMAGPKGAHNTSRGAFATAAMLLATAITDPSQFREWASNLRWDWRNNALSLSMERLAHQSDGTLQVSLAGLSPDADKETLAALKTAVAQFIHHTQAGERRATVVIIAENQGQAARLWNLADRQVQVVVPEGSGGDKVTELKGLLDGEGHVDMGAVHRWMRSTELAPAQFVIAYDEKRLVNLGSLVVIPIKKLLGEIGRQIDVMMTIMIQA